jgi:tellurite resistance protein TerA
MIQLTKKGESINLSKDTNASFGEILVNLNWNQKSSASGGFFSSLFGGGSRNADLDLGCLYELQNGEIGCVQALGNGFGDLKYAPYIQLDQDDQTGASVGGETLELTAISHPNLNAFSYTRSFMRVLQTGVKLTE